MKIKGSSKVVRVFLIALWGALLLFSYLFTLKYSVQAEHKTSTIQKTELINHYSLSGQRTLYFFLHPKCSCSVASIEELESILKEGAGKFKVIAVVSVRSSVDTEFMNSPTVNLLKEFKNIEVFYDIGSIETQKLGITTSGHILFYDSFQNLLYSGGVTVSRGHRGDSLGKMELLKRIHSTENVEKYIADVYGCGFGSKNWK